jgi:hypothetical protein
MEFKAIRDFYGINNTLFRQNQKVTVSDSDLINSKTGKVKPELKHLQPLDKSAEIFYQAHMVESGKSADKGLPEKVRSRGRAGSDPESANPAPAKDAGKVNPDGDLFGAGANVPTAKAPDPIIV